MPREAFSCTYNITHIPTRDYLLPPPRPYHIFPRVALQPALDGRGGLHHTRNPIETTSIRHSRLPSLRISRPSVHLSAGDTNPPVYYYYYHYYYYYTGCSHGHASFLSRNYRAFVIPFMRVYRSRPLFTYILYRLYRGNGAAIQ